MPNTAETAVMKQIDGGEKSAPENKPPSLQQVRCRFRSKKSVNAGRRLVNAHWPYNNNPNQLHCSTTIQRKRCLARTYVSLT